MSQDFLVPENPSSVIVWLTTESTRKSTLPSHTNRIGVGLHQMPAFSSLYISMLKEIHSVECEAPLKDRLR